jgi:hypothetical protein
MYRLTPQLWARIADEFRLETRDVNAFIRRLDAEYEQRETCPIVIKTGAHKGEVCGKTLKDKLCSVHRFGDTPRPPVSKCPVPYKTGKHLGQPCGHACAIGLDTCLVHASASTPGDGCVHAFPNQRICDRKCVEDSAYCAHHKKVHEKIRAHSRSQSAQSARFASYFAPALPTIQCTNKNGNLVIKDTDLVVDASGKSIIGYVVKLTNEAPWVLVREWTPEMAQAMEQYHLECALRPEDEAPAPERVESLLF